MNRHHRARRLVAVVLAVAAVLASGRSVLGIQQGSTPVDRPVAATVEAAGAVRGTVKDETGTAISGAEVMLTDERQRTRQALAGADGAFEFQDVAPGRYQLVVSRMGFAAEYRSVDISAGARPLVDVTMRVAIDQRVEVVASLEEFRRISGLSPAGLILGPEDLAVLPTDPDLMLAVLRELSATTGRADQVAVYVDGQPISSRLPPKEIIQSIRISTNPFASEFAEPSSGLVEILTKPASTTFRGEYQATFNDARLNARNAFEDRKTPSRIHSLSGYLGGPILPRRWSFLAYGGRWQRQDRLVVNAAVADPSNFTVRRFVESVRTPNQIDSYSFRMDVLPLTQHVVSLDYGRTSESQRNAGLESGLDLPERGVDRDAREDTARLSIVSALQDGIGSELRVGVRRRAFDQAAVTTTPAVLVLDTFNAGGNQALLRENSTTREISLSQVLSYTDGRETVRGGVQFDLTRVANQRAANTGGTFIFGAVVDERGNVVATPLDRYLSTLRGLPGYGPSSFSISRGEPSIEASDWRLAFFLQDDVQRSRSVTMSFGLRYDLQRHARLSFLNFAPRAGVAWTPNGNANHTLRAAGGVFYSRVPLEITLDPLRYDGMQTVDLVVDQPRFFRSIPAQLDAAVALSTVRLDHSVRAPITSAANASYEWRVGRALTASVGYTFRRGDMLLRTVNLNEPDVATGIRRRVDLGPMLQFESSGHSTSQELRVTVRRGLPPFSVFGTYALLSSHSDTDGLYTTPANSLTLQSEFGRAADDERHHVAVGSAINLPRDWSVSALLNVGSGRPFNITTGWDNNGDSLFFDRPAAVVAEAPGAIVTPFGIFNAFPGPGEVMIARNAGQGPSQFVLNAGVAKTLRFGGAAGGGVRPYLIVSANVENVTNHINFVDFNGVVTSPLFGTPNRALNPRRVEIAARFGF
jgi:hypothetical protein